MPEKRSGTHRVNVFLTDDAYQVFTSYVSSNYTAADSYGAKSAVMNNAVLCYCDGGKSFNATEELFADLDKLEEVKPEDV